MLIDLQLHSKYSDGNLTPKELVEFVAKQGVRVAALTDHNTISGLSEFKKACQHKGIKAINGLELYVKYNHRKFNILWFNFREDDPELLSLLEETQNRRMKKSQLALERLVRIGFKINIEKALSKYQGYVPINHLIDDIMSIPFNHRKAQKDIGVKHPREEQIIKEYFYDRKLGVFHNSFVSIDRVLNLRKKIGGQIIYNHPGKYGFFKRDVLEVLRKKGIDGLEVLSPHHSIGAVMYAQYIVEELNFPIMTGGSDFHRQSNHDNLIQNSWQYYKIDSKYLRGVEKIIL